MAKHVRKLNGSSAECGAPLTPGTFVRAQPTALAVSLDSLCATCMTTVNAKIKKAASRLRGDGGK